MKDDSSEKRVAAPRKRRADVANAKPDMHAVAREAGVSIATVSRAIHYPNQLAPLTLKLIKETIARLGYVPDLNAGALKSNKSKVIGAIVPTLSNSIFAETVDGLSGILATQGYQLLIGQTGYDQKREAELVEAFLGRRVDGMVLTGVSHGSGVRTHLKRAAIPVVETWDITSRPIDMVAGFNNDDTGIEVAAYLLGQGRKVLAYIGADEERSLKRLKGYSYECQRQNATPVTSLLFDTPVTFNAGRTGIGQLLDGLAPDVDAVFCGNDSIAAGVVFECARRGVVVPMQLAVIGFGDLPIAAEMQPALTSVRVERKRMGECAGQMLLARLLEQNDIGDSVDLGFQLMRRESA